jgi:hypothetical protein
MSEDEDQKLSPTALGEELANLATFVESGQFPRPQRITPRELLELVQGICEAAAARLALARERPVKPRQLAALARVNTERLRQLPRTEDGYIEPRAAREWVSNLVPGIEMRELPVTPSWWQQVLPGDRLRKLAEDVVRRELPPGTVLAPDDRLTRISIGVPPTVSLGDAELSAQQQRIRLALEELISTRKK